MAQRVAELRKKQNARLKKEQQKKQQDADNNPITGLHEMFELDKYKECYIVGGGPSLTNFDWSLLNDKFVIAINRAYEVLPNAQIVYFTDKDYWKIHKDNMIKHSGKLFRGTCVLKDIKHPKVTEWFLSGEHGLETKSGQLRHGRNSTYAAINLAGIHLGFKKINLLGIDMKWGKPGNKSTSHWHDGHKRVDSESAYKMMINNFIKLKGYLDQHKIKVVNINNNSNLKCFPKETLEQHFNLQGK